MYRPGRTRFGRNSSTGTSGSELNSSKEESPTKPVQESVSEKVGSKGDQGSSGQEKFPKKGTFGKEGDDERKEFGSREHSGKAHDRSKKHDRGGRNRRDSNETRDFGGNNSGRSGSRRSEGQEQSHHKEARGRSAKHQQGRTQPDGKRELRDHGKQSVESWEIKPEDWEADVKTPPRERKEKHTESKQASKARDKGNHGAVDHGAASRDVNKDKDIPHKSAEDTKDTVDTQIASLMGDDWDSEFEEQFRAQRRVSRSPPKAHDHQNTSSEKRLETGERLPRNRGNADYRHESSGHPGKKTADRTGPLHTEAEKSKSAPKKDLVRSSRQNYASEMQKLRAKKEQVEKDSAVRKDKESERRKEKESVLRKENESVLKQDSKDQNPSAKDLKITIRTGSDDAEGSRVVQEKSSKRYSTGRSRQRVNSESSTGSENVSHEKMAPKPDEWESGIDDLNYHVESMVITNQKYASRDMEKHTAFQSSHDESRKSDKRERRRDEVELPSNRNEDTRQHSSKQQNEDHGNRKERLGTEKREVHGQLKERQQKREHHDEKTRREREQERHRHGSRSDRDQREHEVRGRHGSGGRREEPRRRDRDRVSVCSDDSSEKQGRRRGSSDMEESSNKHGGGILRLPGKKELEGAEEQHNYVPVYDQYYQPAPTQISQEAPKEEEPKAKAKARVGDKSRLWDPSKPNQKPALQQHHAKHELHFQDPEHEVEAERMESSPAAQQDGWNPYYPYYPPGFGGVFPPNLLPHPGMRPPFPPPGYMAPPPSWADQVEASHAYQSGQAPPHPPPPMMQYPPPFRAPPYHPPPGLPPPQGFSNPGLPPPQGFPNPAHLAMMHEPHPVNRQSAQKLLRDAARCEGELSEALSHGIASKDALKHLLDKQ